MSKPKHVLIARGNVFQCKNGLHYAVVVAETSKENRGAGALQPCVNAHAIKLSKDCIEIELLQVSYSTRFALKKKGFADEIKQNNIKTKFNLLHFHTFFCCFSEKATASHHCKATH
jgi:hypothetical protein